MKNKSSLFLPKGAEDCNTLSFSVSGPDLEDVVYRLCGLWLAYADPSLNVRALSPKEKKFLYLCVLAYVKNGCVYCPESVDMVSNDPIVKTKQMVYKLRGDLVEKGFMTKTPSDGKRDKIDIVPIFKINITDGKASVSHTFNAEIDLERKD